MIVGIGGLSRSGKTTLARDIQKKTTLSVFIAEQDDYVKAKNDIPTINGITDWECPGSIDYNSFREKVLREAKEYDLVLAVGLLVFYDKHLCSSFDKSILISTDKETFLKRKKKDTRWGHIPKWFMDHIWNSYQYYGELGLSKDHIRVVSQNNLDLKAIFNYLNIK